MATLEEIARLAGVSKSTVSRALADSPLISERTKRRVKQIASRANYQPDVRAKSLRTRISHTITLLIHSDQPRQPNLTDPFALKFIGLVGTELRKRNYDMLIAIADCRDPETGNNYVRSGKSDGLIVFGRLTDDSALQHIAAGDIPVICWGIPTSNVRYHSVGIDNVALVREVVEKLIQAGRRRIGFIGSEQACAEYGLRFSGYRQAFLEAGLDVKENLVIIQEESPRPGYRAMQKILDSAQPDAIFACSDVRALEACQAIREAGLNIPRDVAVVGFDNIELGKCSSPALSTISQGITDGGAAQLVNTLLKAIQVKSLIAEINNHPSALQQPLTETAATRTIMLPGQFIVRESCGLLPLNKR